MRSLRICTCHHCSGDHIEKNENDESCSKNVSSRCANRDFGGKHEEKSPLGRYSRRLDCNIKMYFQEV
jgi:hypothetical protein